MFHIYIREKNILGFQSKKLNGFWQMCTANFKVSPEKMKTFKLLRLFLICLLISIADLGWILAVLRNFVIEECDLSVSKLGTTEPKCNMGSNWPADIKKPFVWHLIKKRLDQNMLQMIQIGTIYIFCVFYRKNYITFR